ncbi:hypothetical protein DENSPDRAFT_856326 [Dentipellis sp. KUC8613]|nr:hypothetical protein DENSPDRAFT_856326 [Dentipellis sp. KUC8613]
MLRASPAIQGYQIPGLSHRVLISLFADDTALYLSEHDRYHDVKAILDQWCTALGACFNIHKTEVTATRKLHPDDPTPLPTGITIAPDHHAIRYLGAWIGNNLDDDAPWETTLDKIRNTLNAWLSAYPTLAGKRHVIQMVVGSMTQYLTTVQGMPTTILHAVTKEIQHFLWPDRHSAAIDPKYLYRSPDHGSLGLLDVKARNEAIELMWLKSYLDLSTSRPAWAFVADTLINRLTPPHVTDLTVMNTFLQTWTPPLQGARANTLPPSLLRMLQAAKKYHIWSK